MYPLQAGSLRVVSGRNDDEAAADSNGAGKSALVMAPLWALTGRTDARLEVGKQAPSPVSGLSSNMNGSGKGALSLTAPI